VVGFKALFYIVLNIVCQKSPPSAVVAEGNLALRGLVFPFQGVQATRYADGSWLPIDLNSEKRFAHGS